jgi:MFS transporter, SP family, xylose:H+ symportor
MHGTNDLQNGASAACYNRGYVLAISTIAALGGFLFGYDWVVIGGAKPFFERYFQLTTEAQVGWANSCALLGCLLGSIAAGSMSDRLGRKKTLIASALLFAVSSLLTGWASAFNWFVTWRIVGGVAIGMASGVSPMYIAEISPAPWRGRLVALNQLTIVLGILLAQVANYWIAERVPDGATAEMIRLSWNGQYAWRYMFSAVAIPSAVFFFSVMLVPESPRWLVLRGREDLAFKTLARIGGKAYGEEGLREIHRSAESNSTDRVHWAELMTPGARKVLGIGILLAALQQWSGINVIFNYAEEIYRGAGYGVSDVMLNIVITGAINLIFTLIAIGTVDRFGRRALMLLGFGGICLSHLLLGTAFALHATGMPILVLTLCTIACYAMTIAPVIWVLISEIFPNRIRSAGVSAAVSALWIACFALTFTFPVLNRTLGPAGTFWVYGTICLLGALFVWRYLPETKNKTLEEIERDWAAAPKP